MSTILRRFGVFRKTIEQNILYQLYQKQSKYIQFLGFKLISKRQKFYFQRIKWYPVYGFILSFSSEKKTNLTDILKEADELFNENRYDDVCKLLEGYKDTDEAEILWRLSRALYNKSNSVNSAEKYELIRVGYDIINKAMILEENNFAVHKWFSILADAKASSEGIKSRIKQLINVKNHMLRAVELNPNDATTYYMLGEWCYGIASLPWHQKKIASTFFATPPNSSFEEALFYFNKAEEIESHFYSKNLLMLGKTYLQLNDNDKALYYLELAAKYPAKTDSDHQVNKEAFSLLRKFKK